jgi:ADP-ribose pyrophosphatase YjhB (NUDIX family)
MRSGLTIGTMRHDPRLATFLVAGELDRAELQVHELDESITDGLVREVREETGLVVEPLALTGIYKNMKRGIVALVFRCRLVSGEAIPTPEANEVAWVRSDELHARMSEAYTVRLLDALDSHRAIPIRNHDGTALLAGN